MYLQPDDNPDHNSANKLIAYGYLAVAVVVTCGIALSLFQFFLNRSLWLDEASLALNIIDRKWNELLTPLDLMQSAPILFLYIEKLASQLIPHSDYGLRLFPLFCYWTAGISLYLILRHFCNSNWSTVIGLSLFFFNHTLLYYSSEVKQYMGDVLVLCTVFSTVLSINLPMSKRSCILLSLMGSVAIFLSNIAPVVLLTSGCYLLYRYLKEKKGWLGYLLIVFSVWLLIFVLYYTLFIAYNPHMEGMNTFWAPTFISGNPFKIYLYRSLFTNFSMISNVIVMSSGPVKFIFIGLYIAGIVRLLRNRSFGMIILGLMPFASHFMLTILKLYPFDIKFTLYLLPVTITVCISGLEYAAHFFNRIIHYHFLVILLSFGLFCQLFKVGFPVEKEELKKALSFIQNNSTGHEPVYVYYGAKSSFLYYTRTGFFRQTDHIIYGQSYRDNAIRYRDELPKPAGAMWFVFSHVYNDEEIHILNLVDSMGGLCSKEIRCTGASAYQYNFSSGTSHTY